MKLTLTAIAAVIGLAALNDRIDHPTLLPVNIDQPTDIHSPLRIGHHTPLEGSLPITLAEEEKKDDWRCRTNPRCGQPPEPVKWPEPEKPRYPWPIRLA